MGLTLMSARSHSPLVLITSLECISMSSLVEEWSSLMSEAANNVHQSELTRKQAGTNILWVVTGLQKLNVDDGKLVYRSEGRIQKWESSSEHRRGRCRWRVGRWWPLWLVYHRIRYLCCVGTHMELRGNCLHPCWEKKKTMRLNELLKDPE